MPFMKVDLHVHASERSGCSQLPQETQIQEAIRLGLDGLAFTDHNKLISLAEVQRLTRQYAPFKIYRGIERTCNGEDIVILGVEDPAIETVAHDDYAGLHAFVRAQGGFMFLAHPFRYHPEIRVDLAGYPPDGIEVASVSTPAADEEQIRQLAAEHNLVLLANSDSHYMGPMGRFYNEVSRWVSGIQELMAALRRRETTPVIRR